MEEKDNNNEELVDESKKRKCDEEFDNIDYSNEVFISYKYMKVEHDYTNNTNVDASTDHCIDIDSENIIDANLEEENEIINYSVNNELMSTDYDDANIQNVEELVSVNDLIKKIEEFGERMTNKVSSEVATLRKILEDSIHELKYSQQKVLNDLTIKIDKFTEINAQYEEEKNLLMKEKIELENKLKDEKKMRLELLENRPTDISDSEKCETYDVLSHSSLEPENNKSSSLMQNIELESFQYDPSIPLAVRHKMPKKLSFQVLGEEIRKRRHRRNHLIMKGVRPSKTNLLDDITKLIHKKTGVVPEITDLKILKSGVLLVMKTLGNKLEIMRRSGPLKVMNITLEDDLTPREYYVQKWLKEIEAEDQKLGKDTVAAFFKIKQDGVWKVWNEREGRLVIDERSQPQINQTKES